MIWLDLASCGLLCALFFATLVNLALFKKPAPTAWPADHPHPAPFVSILIPARNEANRIAPCLESLINQDYPNYEILVLDDNSTDATRAVVQNHGFSDATSASRRLIAGKPLPPGWKGKPWACQQLSEAAHGDYLLFTDADTVHAHGMLAGALLHSLKTKADLLSLWPRQIVVSWAEKLVVPFMNFLIVTLLPQWALALLQQHTAIARRLPQSVLASFGAANGQFMLFRKAAYTLVGGHNAVRDHLVEDIALGRLVAARIADGVRLVNADGQLLVQCRMYNSLREVWEGFSKNLRPAFDNSLSAFVLFGLVQFIAFLLPFLRLGISGPSLLTLSSIALVYSIRSLQTWRFGLPWSSCLLHPLGHAFSLLIALNSWRLHAAGRLNWKGRVYKT
jgi:chlorobactene glucosyltransferase